MGGLDTIPPIEAGPLITARRRFSLLAPEHRAGNIDRAAGRLSLAADFPEVAQTGVAAAVGDPLDAQAGAGLGPRVVVGRRGEGVGLCEVAVKAPEQGIWPGTFITPGERLFEEAARPQVRRVTRVEPHGLVQVGERLVAFVAPT